MNVLENQNKYLNMCMLLGAVNRLRSSDISDEVQSVDSIAIFPNQSDLGNIFKKIALIRKGAISVPFSSRDVFNTNI